MKTQIITLISSSVLLLASCSDEPMFVTSPTGEPVAAEVAAMKDMPSAPVVNYLDGAYRVIQYQTQNSNPPVHGMILDFHQQGVVYAFDAPNRHKGTWALDTNNGTVQIDFILPAGHPITNFNSTTWRIQNHPSGLLFVDISTPDRRFIVEKTTSGTPMSNTAMN